MIMDHNYGVLITINPFGRFYIAWRKTIRRFWRLDKKAHNVLINLINAIPSNFILEKRCVKYIWNLYNSSHELHNTVVKNCFFYNKGSTLAENIRYLMYKYDITII